jgi:hypothetical protein
MVKRSKNIMILVSMLALIIVMGGMLENNRTYAADYSVEVWNVSEITLTSTQAYSDPFNDVVVEASFYGPGGALITRPAFWDGGNTWKIRFAPTATGLWTMSTTASDPSDTGLHGISLTIQSDSYTGSHDIYERGFLKASDNGRYLVYADGTPFFYLGDTHWTMPHERFDTSNVPGVASQFKYTVDKRVQQGFTVYQSQPIWQPHGGGSHLGSDEEAVANLTDGFTAADLAGFHNLDRKFDYIAKQGLVHAAAQVSWVGDPANFPLVFTEDFMTKLGRYWVARYGAYPVIWTIGQEIDKNLYGAYDATTIEKWFAVGKGIADHDSYGHLIMPHMEGTSVTTAANSWWMDQPYHGGWATQMSIGMDGMSTARTFWEAPIAKPAVLYETGYENFWADAKGALGAGYKAFQYGIFGYGYGAAGVWNDIYSKPGEPADYGTEYELPLRYYWWYDGANLRTADQLAYFKQFYTSLEWWKLTPRFDSSTWSAFVTPEHSLLSTDGNETYVAYFFGSGTSTGTLKNMSTSATYTAKWYDPRNGQYTALDTFKAPSGTWTVPNRPTSDEWMLLVSSEPTASNEGATNQAAYKPVAVSGSSAGFGSELAVDGLYDTSWIAGSGVVPQWLTVDLGGIKQLESIETGFNREDTWNYKLEGSLDQVSWTTLADHTAAGRTARDMSDSVTGDYRFVRITVTGFLAPSMVAISEFRILGYDESELLSRNKTTAVSSDNGTGCSGGKAVDGNDVTYWCAEDAAMPQWLSVDLGVPSRLEKIVMNFYGHTTWKYKLEGSLDSVTWTTLADRTVSGVTGQTASDEASGIYRYVRITITDSGHWAAIREFDVYGKPNAASGKLATASSISGIGYEEDKALDGLASTYWCASDGTKPQWLNVDLGSLHDLSEARIHFYSLDSWKYKLEGSTDGSSWSVLADHTASGVLGQMTADTLSGSYRYVRITITDSVNWAAIRELELYE